MKKFNVAVVGATGMVGRKFLQVLEERKLPSRTTICSHRPEAQAKKSALWAGSIPSLN